MTTPTYYKWLTPENRGVYGHGDYTDHLPHGKRPGKWLPAVKDPRPCVRGYHVVDIAHLPAHWGIPGVLYEVEVRGKTVEDGDKTACAQIRLVRRVGELTPGIAVTFAADCAARVLPLFEAEYPDDDRPRRAIEAARSGDAYAAANAANAAAYAAYAAANAAYAAYAAYAANAAYAAANAANAANAAAYAAAYAANAAANAAAYAAYAAANDAYAAAYAKESAWQGRHLVQLIEKENAR